MLEWGIKIADALHTRVYLEATHAGLPLYRKYGWKVLEQLVLDLEQYGERGKEVFTLMLREPASLGDPEL